MSERIECANCAGTGIVGDAEPEPCDPCEQRGWFVATADTRALNSLVAYLIGLWREAESERWDAYDASEEFRLSIERPGLHKPSPFWRGTDRDMAALELRHWRKHYDRREANVALITERRVVGSWEPIELDPSTPREHELNLMNEREGIA